MNPSHRRIVVSLVAAATVLAVGTTRPAEGQPMPTGAAVMAWHVTIAPSWFDPSTAPPQITPFGMLYAIHDALVRPLPGQKMGPSLAESWTESPDGLTYEFKLRRGLKFHNGDPVTADDVRFSFERYKGTGAKELGARVQRVEVVDALVVRFHLREPWPDFMTFYGTTATAAGIVVPKRYLEQVGDDGFRKHPIGAGPYKFVSHTPGVEVVLEAYGGHWRRVPNVKRLIMKSVPEGTTRVAMLKSGEADIAYVLDGPEAEDVKRDPLRAGSQGHQRSRLSRLLPAGRGHRPPGHGLCPAGRASTLRPAQGEAAPRRGRLSPGLRRGRAGADPPVLHDGGGLGELSERGRDPGADAAAGACGVLRRLAGEEAPRALPHRRRERG
ncbi:MAG: hypothetical protein DME12_10625 [Candidatus Rokuibacteriota bacterium]|nr:MAG: hypothetical protein DME12_10625 [Candidatus Rokubacteria bacterium]